MPEARKRLWLDGHRAKGEGRRARVEVLWTSDELHADDLHTTMTLQLNTTLQNPQECSNKDPVFIITIELPFLSLLSRLRP